jgi:outer membrane protein OmpA-like peptidoglycan-associated protein
MSTTFRGLLLGFTVAAIALLAAHPLQAQSRTFYLDRAQLSGAPDDGFMVWRPHLWDETRFYGMAALGYSHNPLRATTVTDNPRTADRIDNPVQGQLTTYLLAGTEIAGRASLNVQLPIVLYQFTGDDPQAAGIGAGGIADTHTAIQDLRLDARIKLFESESKKLRLGFGGAVWVPTGNPVAFTSDYVASGMLYGSGEYDFGKFLISGMLGPHFKPASSIGGANGSLFIDDELRWAVGAYLPLRQGKIRLGAELWGTTGLVEAGGERTLFAGRNTDLEWLAQVRYLVDQAQTVWAMAGFGTRLTAGYGAPDFRILVSIGKWFTISDTEPPTRAHAYSGTPGPRDYDKDTDGDGYPDAIDKCPTIKEDGAEPDPTDGCPAGSDRDGDGIPDIDDQCPDVPEDKDGVEDADGCPETDADNDKIPDVEDKCPTEPGPRSAIAEKNGCPSLTRVTEEGEVALLEPIQFEFGKAAIKPVSFPILDEVVTLMKARGGMRLGVYGHTDSVGADATNLRLSKDRAASVMRYIINKGIKQARLESEGYGESKPLETNDTAEGRAQNRRVEFKILSE